VLRLGYLWHLLLRLSIVKILFPFLFKNIINILIDWLMIILVLSFFFFLELLQYSLLVFP
jgi:hypothetical protein